MDLVHIERVEPREDYWLRLWFSNGAIKDVDMSEVVSKGPVFEQVRSDRAVFAEVRVNPHTRTIEWPGEVDLDPTVLYGTYEPASGARLKRRVIREPDPAAA